MTKWQTHSSEVVYETPWIRIKRDEVTNHTGKHLTYSYMELHHNAVTILAVNANGHILLQKNYRYTLGQEMWELPAGHTDGEESLHAAKRELLEEAGLQSDQWTSLGYTYLAAGVAKIRQDLFLAENVYEVTKERDPDEAITSQQFIAPGEVKKMLAENVIVDGDSMVALYRYFDKLEATS